MNILIYEWKNFGIEDLKDALQNMGHRYTVVTTDLIYERVNKEFDDMFNTAVEKDHFDAVFTFNYSAVISNCCNRHNIPYIGFVYDSPLVALYSYTIINPCNYIFIFDKELYNSFAKEGITTVYYCPLVANTKRLSKMIKEDAPITDLPQSSHKVIRPSEYYKGDISFVGSMYNEKHNLFEKLSGMSDFYKGYLDGIMASQLKVYGYNFIEDMINGPLLEELQRVAPLSPNKDGVETVQYMYAQYFIARKMANMERTSILSRLSDNFSVNVYTPNATPELPKIHNRGPVDYYNHMPYIFNHSKINLNITLRSIKSGIPLRGIDIMGAGGFLMSNFQADFYDYFTPGEDCVLFESEDDLVKKCSYYLSHDNERRQIALNGFEKVNEYHTYEKRLGEIFELIFN